MYIFVYFYVCICIKHLRNTYLPNIFVDTWWLFIRKKIPWILKCFRVFFFTLLPLTGWEWWRLWFVCGYLEESSESRFGHLLHYLINFNFVLKLKVSPCRRTRHMMSPNMPNLALACDELHTYISMFSIMLFFKQVAQALE